MRGTDAEDINSLFFKKYNKTLPLETIEKIEAVNRIIYEGVWIGYKIITDAETSIVITNTFENKFNLLL